MPVLLNAGQILTAQARLRPNATGARDLDRTLTYQAWNARSCRLSNALAGMGLSKGDRVAVLAYNRLVGEAGSITGALDNFADEFSTILARQIDRRGTPEN